VCGSTVTPPMYDQDFQLHAFLYLSPSKFFISCSAFVPHIFHSPHQFWSDHHVSTWWQVLTWWRSLLNFFILLLLSPSRSHLSFSDSFRRRSSSTVRGTSATRRKHEASFWHFRLNIYGVYGRQGYEILNGAVASSNPKLISNYFLRG
jgi:hypothetical protein